MDEMDLTVAESKATYDESKAYVLEHGDLKVSICTSLRSSGSAVWMLGKIIICQKRKMPKCCSAHRKRRWRL